jgi:anti-anti-sigma factor
MSFPEALKSYNALHVGSHVELRCRDELKLLLALSGELDLKTSNDLTPILEAAILECPPMGRLVLDLSRVGYISSTGIGLLTTSMIAAEKRDLAFILLDVPARVRNVMNTLGLMAFFKVEDSCE